jgi:hypothetical protein
VSVLQAESRAELARRAQAPEPPITVIRPWRGWIAAERGRAVAGGFRRRPPAEEGVAQLCAGGVPAASGIPVNPARGPVLPASGRTALAEVLT